MEYHQPTTAHNSFRKSSDIKREKMQTDLMFIVGEFEKILLTKKSLLINVKRLVLKYSFTLLKQKLVCI